MPKPHTPFQWAAQLDAETTDARLAKLLDAVRARRQYGKAIGFRYHDGKPGIIEGLLSRGDRRVGRIIEAVWRDGGRFDGWSEHFSYERWIAVRREGAGRQPVDLDWYTTREREYAEVLPWDHLDSGLDRDWLWEDWQDALETTAHRGRGLPLDAVLRLRRLPADGHRDPDRTDRPEAAAALRGLTQSRGVSPPRYPPPPTATCTRSSTSSPTRRPTSTKHWSGQTEGWPHVNLDGKVFETDRAPARNDNGHDAWYSGKPTISAETSRPFPAGRLPDLAVGSNPAGSSTSKPPAPRLPASTPPPHRAPAP